MSWMGWNRTSNQAWDIIFPAGREWERGEAPVAADVWDKAGQTSSSRHYESIVSTKATLGKHAAQSVPGQWHILDLNRRHAATLPQYAERPN